jgi:hypothetical protein
VFIAVGVLGVAIATGNHQRHEAGFDVLDEGAHYDYVEYLLQGHLPRSGDRLTQQTMRMISCVGAYATPPHGCSEKHRNPAAEAADGYSYEGVQQPPLGYLPYLLTVEKNGASQSALDNARWGGFIWSVVAAGLLVWVGWLVALSLLEMTAVLAICLLSPVQIHAMATVTTDSSAIAAGAAVVAVFLLSRRRQKPMVAVGLAVGLIVGFMKGLFVVAPFILLVGVIIGEIARRRRPKRVDFWARYGCSLALTVGAFISYAAWLLIQDATAKVPPSTVLHAVESFSMTNHFRLSTILNGAQQELSDLSAYVSAPLYWLWDLAVYGSLAGLLVLRGPVGKIWQRSMALAIFVGILVLAAAFPLLNFIEGHYDFYTPARYALPTLPIVALVFVRSMRTWGVLIAGVALPAAAVIMQLVQGQF